VSNRAYAGQLLGDFTSSDIASQSDLANSGLLSNTAFETKDRNQRRPHSLYLKMFDAVAELAGGPAPDLVAGVEASSSANLLTKDLLGYERDMKQFNQEHAATLDRLRREYQLSSTSGVESFLRIHRSLAEILIDAIPHLRETFGDDTVFRIDVGSDENPIPEMLYTVALWQGSPALAKAALERFDESWWIGNSSRANGRLVFDYELV
jgi:hypothetical protein